GIRADLVTRGQTCALPISGGDTEGEDRAVRGLPDPRELLEVAREVLVVVEPPAGGLGKHQELRALLLRVLKMVERLGTVGGVVEIGRASCRDRVCIWGGST